MRFHRHTLKTGKIVGATMHKDGFQGTKGVDIKLHCKKCMYPYVIYIPGKWTWGNIDKMFDTHFEEQSKKKNQQVPPGEITVTVNLPDPPQT